MPNIFEIVQQRQLRDRYQTDQQLTQGVITAVQQGQYQVTIGGVSHLCMAGISESLKVNMRVYVLIGRGTSRIIGLMGKDENAA